MRPYFILFFSFLISLSPFSAQATHIVGAELFYECLNPQTFQYEITLKMYRDCDNGQAPFDNPIVLFVFDGNTGARLQTVNIAKPPLTPQLVPQNWNACVGSTYNICVEEGTYETQLTLPPRPGGYDLAWARCCRNQAITNLANPLGEGATFLAHIPDSALAQCNSMPVFNQFPPIFLCANQPFNFDHSATDPDGDSLVYRIVDPYTGLDFNGAGAGNPTQNPAAPSPVVNLANPMGSPPYRTVTFAPGYDWFDPFGSSNFTINSQTGFISVTPNQTGIFVFAISVFEYRNGVLLSENRRDFQIHVLNCLPQGQPPVISHDLSGLPHSNDTVFVNADEPFCFPVTVTDSNAADTLTAYTVSAAFGNGTFTPPLATFNWSGINPISGQVCWRPACAYINQTIPLVLGAFDIGDCPNIADVFDTVYVKISAPPNLNPGISYNFGNLDVRGDTICVIAEDSMCFDFLITDPDGQDTLFPQVRSPLSVGSNSFSLTMNGINPVVGALCAVPSCNQAGQVFPIYLEAIDQSHCNLLGEVYDTLYVKVYLPPNAGPAIQTNLGGLTTRGDTIFVFANDSLCFDFTLSDPDLTNQLIAYPISPVFSSADPPSFSWLGSNPIRGQICWQPGCQYVNQVIPLIFGGRDDARCNSWRDVEDTVYVVVQVPPNRPPAASHDFRGLNRTLGDTIYVDATERFCYRIDFSDLDVGDSLSIFPASPIFSTATPAPTLTPLGTNPVVVQVCWEPGCNYQGQTLPLIVGGRDNGACQNSLLVYDTVWVKVSTPVTSPPRIIPDLSGTNHRGDTIYVDLGDSVCYRFMVIDSTFDNGLDARFEFQDLGGTNLGYGSYQLTQRNDTIFGQVCFKPLCVTGGKTYRNVIFGIDKPTCPPFDQVEKVLYVKVNTDFLAFAGADVGFCEGTGGTQLTANPIGGKAPYTYRWRCSDPGNCGFGNPYAQTTQVNPNRTATYAVQITDADGCSSEIDSIVVNVYPKPRVDAGPDVYLCEGAPGIFLSPRVLNPTEAPPPYRYQWSPRDGLVNASIPNTYANPDTTTIYTLQVTSGNGCSSFTTTLDTNSTVIVHRVETPLAEAGPDQDICLGDSAQLLGSAQGSHPPFRYEWTPALGMSQPGFQAPRASPDFTVTYFLVAWSQGCPSPADSVRVRVHTLPTAEPGEKRSICLGDSIRLPGIAGGDLASDYTYRWQPGRGLSDSLTAQPWAFPDTTISYQLEATSIYGCGTVPYDVSVRVKPTPLAEAGPGGFICRGDSFQLQASHGFGGEPAGSRTVFYTWDAGEGLKDRYLPNPKVSPQFTTAYRVGVAYEGCQTFDEVVVEVFNAVDAGVIFADTTRFCQGDSVQLQAYAGAGGATYQWTPAMGLSDPAAQNPWATPDSSQTYTVRIQEGKCGAEDSIRLEVIPTPKADFQQTALRGCAPLEVSFAATDPTAIAYIWDFGDGSRANNLSSPFHTFQQAGIYPVRLTVLGRAGCSSQIGEGDVEVGQKVEARFESQPGPGRLELPQARIQLWDRSIGATGWNWDFGDGKGSSEQHPVHAFQAPGSYRVRLVAYDDFGCADTFSLGPFELIAPDLFIPNVFSPNQDGINDVFLVEYTGPQEFFLQIRDRWGVLVFESQQPDASWQGQNLRGAAVNEGVYYYLLRIGTKTYKGNVTVVR